MGFPPKYIDAPHSAIIDTDLKMRNGEMLILEEAELPITMTTTSSSMGMQSKPRQRISHKNYSNIPKSPKGPFSPHAEGFVARRVIPADNSCLFNSIAYCLEGTASRKNNRARSLRQVCADIVGNDPTLYNEHYLGRTPHEYLKFIKKDESWGGAIEIAILSDFYEMQICAFDIQTGKNYRYGEEKPYESMICILYNGIHYDALSLSPMPNGDEMLDLTQFSTKDTGVIQRMSQYVGQLRSQHAFTNTNSFSLQCLVCYKKLQGAKE
eukprot:CAMPEP_0117432508 /NCGR_PEP_ID=MMETSP0758-20121206/11981_1 /TAXON_ID=63605 /ORGANISM="Percolomonas cosmopolitus, Strain AE-1 (ATCC 50343)" /LENGTH=266 /DNA_ID=CAMNT_0005222465 /DNA_START=165 /DNA_END=962 /DNA_ORIENTATION=-